MFPSPPSTLHHPPTRPPFPLPPAPYLSSYLDFFPSSRRLLAVLACIRRGGSCASNVNGVWYIWRSRAFVVVAWLSYQSARRRDKVASIRGAISHTKRKERTLWSRVEKHSSAVDNSDISSCKDNVSVFVLFRLFLVFSRLNGRNNRAQIDASRNLKKRCYGICKQQLKA